MIGKGRHMGRWGVVSRLIVWYAIFRKPYNYRDQASRLAHGSLKKI